MKKITTVDKHIRKLESSKKGKREVRELEAELKVAQQMWGLMESRGLSIRDVSRKMGTSPSQIHRVLSFEVSTSLSTLVRFADAVDCSFDIVFTAKHPTAKADQSVVAFEAIPGAGASVVDAIMRIEERTCQLDERSKVTESLLRTLVQNKVFVTESAVQAVDAEPATSQDLKITYLSPGPGVPQIEKWGSSTKCGEDA
jgi:transcriptional regulator with XRE-family HTH domain